MCWLSIRLRALNLALRLVAKPYLRHLEDIPKARRFTDWAISKTYSIPKDVNCSDYSMRYDDAEVPARRFSSAQSDRNKVLLYFHGGGYFSGSFTSHAGIASRLAQLTEFDVVLPEYRLAPEHPFPAAIEDALTCYRSLLDQGYASKNIALCGESAGGGLALGLLHCISSDHLEQPACSCVFSPWTDLTLSGQSLNENALSDVIIPTIRLPETAAKYLGGAPSDDPRASPLFGDFSGTGPILFHASRTEALYDDSQRLTRRLQVIGCDVRFDSWKSTPHGWHLFYEIIPEARNALEKAAVFLKSHMTS